MGGIFWEQTSSYKILDTEERFLAEIVPDILSISFTKK